MATWRGKYVKQWYLNYLPSWWFLTSPTVDVLDWGEWNFVVMTSQLVYTLLLFVVLLRRVTFCVGIEIWESLLSNFSAWMANFLARMTGGVTQAWICFATLFSFACCPRRPSSDNRSRRCLRRRPKSRRLRKQIKRFITRRNSGRGNCNDDCAISDRVTTDNDRVIVPETQACEEFSERPTAPFMTRWTSV